MLRDDRAEITGREVARWNVLLEEPQPREERQAPAAGEDGERQVRPARESAEPRRRPPPDPLAAGADSFPR